VTTYRNCFNEVERYEILVTLISLIKVRSFVASMDILLILIIKIKWNIHLYTKFI